MAHERPQHVARRDGATRPIDAAQAALAAAHSDGEAAGRHRRDAMGTGRRAGDRDDATSRSRLIAVACAVAGIAAAALIIFVIGGAVGRALLSDGTAQDGAPETSIGREADGDGVSTVADSADGAYGPSDEIVLNGWSYRLEKADDGAWSLASRAAGSSGEAAATFEVGGEAVGTALHEGVLYIVSNRDGSHLIQSLLPSDGAAPADWKRGDGEVGSIALDGSELVLEMADGSRETVDLAS